MKKIILIAIFVCAVFFAGCADDEAEFNRSASYWYEQMIVALTEGNLEKADNYFNSLQNEHSASPLIKEALIMLAKAHSENNEQLLAGFFANEFKTRFSDEKNTDYAGFLIMQTSYYAFGNYTKDQGFINDNVSEISSFITLNQNNKYLPYIRHILTSFKLAQLEVNKEIARVYRIKDKDSAEKKYLEQSASMEGIEFEPSHIPWYVKIFSW